MTTADCGFAAQPEQLVTIGPTLKVQLGFDRNYHGGVGAPPKLPSQEYLALVDTGATASCIDSQVALNLGLPVIDQESVAGVHGSLKVNVQLAQIHIPSLGFTQIGEFSGVHLHAGGQPHSALLGRTLLQFMKMIYDGTTGAVTIRYH